MADLTVTAAQVGVVYPELAEIMNVVLAEAVTKGQALYQLSTGTFGIADANAAGKQQFRGIALEAGGALKKGHCYGFTLSGMNHDALAYLSDTAGALADAAGTLTVNVGRVVAMPDNSKTKVLYIEADWLRAWS